MARKALVSKTDKKINLVQKYSKKRAELKDSIYKKDLPMKDRINLVQKLDSLPKSSSKVRVRNICFITGRSRGVVRKYGISRHKIRDLMGVLMLPGLTKSSW